MSSWNLDFRIDSIRVVNPMDLHIQQPPRGEIWIGITRDLLKSKSRLYKASITERMTVYLLVRLQYFFLQFLIKY